MLREAAVTPNTKRTQRLRGCGIEPRNDEIAGAETVFTVERNMCNAAMRGHCRPAGVKGHITRKRIASEPGISRGWPPSCQLVLGAAARIGKVRSRSR